MDFYVEFLNAQLPDTDAIVLKTIRYNQIVKSLECESIRKKVEGFSKILVPLRMEEIDRAHWLLYSINVCDNQSSVNCVLRHCQKGKIEHTPKQWRSIFPRHGGRCSLPFSKHVWRNGFFG